jgi:threonine dehydrogenase-like Zn-dependent dehydrogenase
VALPLANLHAVPDTLADDVAVFVEPLAAAWQVVEQVALSSTTRVLVLGDGKLGGLVGRVLQYAGARVTVCGRHPHKLAPLAADGIATCRPESVPSPGTWDVVVEATGSESGLELALTSVRPQGIVVLKTTMTQPSTLQLATIVINEVRVLGSRCGPFAPALRSLSEAHIDPRPSIDAVYPWPQALAAFERAATPGVLKVLLDMRV